MARHTDLGKLLTIDSISVHARIDHNFNLLRNARETFVEHSERVAAMQFLYAKEIPGNRYVWTLSLDAAKDLEHALADAYISFRALIFRIDWTLGVVGQFIECMLPAKPKRLDDKTILEKVRAAHSAPRNQDKSPSPILSGLE